MENNINSIFGAPLASRVAVYVPSTVDVDREGHEVAEQMTAYTARTLAELFGGATASSASGYWVSDNAGLVQEAVTIVYASCTREDLEQHAQKVREIAETIKRVMSQEAVSVEINGALYLV